MDRTKEFSSNVEITEIPQITFENASFHTNINQIEKEIDGIFLRLSKLTGYESFKTQTSTKQTSEFLKKCTSTQINVYGGSRV